MDVITTVCMNPSFDRTLEVEDFREGVLNRIVSTREDLGGKGINVAVVLRRLGLDVQCVGLSGEENAGRLLGMMTREAIPAFFYRVPGSVRTNIKVISTGRTRSVTEINERGPVISASDFRRLVSLLEDKAGDSELLVLTGSLPPGCEAGTYRNLMECVHCPVIVDTGGAELMESLKAHPLMVKPNLQELSETLGRTPESIPEIRSAAMDLVRAGAGMVCVSMGERGAMLVSRDHTYFGRAPSVSVQSTVGAGDALVAGWIHGWKRSGNPAEALRCGIASGTASTLVPGTGAGGLQSYHELLSEVSVSEI